MCSLLFPLQNRVTALFIACNNGHTLVVKLLLEAKAKTDVQAKVMFTTVAYLFCPMYTDCVSIVLE